MLREGLLQSQATPLNPLATLFTAVALALAVIAIVRSPRKWHTLFFIIGWVVLFVAVAIGIGFAFGSASAAGAYAAIAMQIGLLAAAIERIRHDRKSLPPK